MIPSSDRGVGENPPFVAFRGLCHKGRSSRNSSSSSTVVEWPIAKNRPHASDATPGGCFCVEQMALIRRRERKSGPRSFSCSRRQQPTNL